MTNMPTLALRIDFEWLVYGAVGVAVVISWISNTMKQMRQSGHGRSLEKVLEQRVRQLTRQGKSIARPGASGSGNPQLDQLAAKRRRQLQELARRQQGPTTGKQPKPISSSSSRTTPTSAATTQRQRLQQARARAQSQSVSSQRQRPMATRSSKVTRQASKPQRVSRPAQQTRGRATHQPRTMQPQSRQAPKRQAPAPREHETPPPQPQAQRLIKSTTPATREQATVLQPLGSQLRTKGLQRTSLREAVILKEILDRPLALRDPAIG